MEKLNHFLNFVIIPIKDHDITVMNLITIGIIILLTSFILWLIRNALQRKNVLRKLDEGSSFALYQLIKYVTWIISILMMLEAINIQPGVILAGSAALLVGIGLGLQQTFNDFISGIILLFEQSVKVGDILDIDGDVVIIQEIGLRTSKGLNRQDIVTLLPNSVITTNKVINWSHQSKKTIFKIKVGVAYGSDVDLVTQLLEESAIEHPEVVDQNSIEARFIDFGNSSLDFELRFYSESIFRIERVKSEIRKTINQKFIDNKVTIPFPQVDVHMK